MKEFFDAIGALIEILVRVGITEGPLISDAIQRSTRGEDPLGGLIHERLGGIFPNGLQLEIAMAAEHVRRTHLSSGAPTP